MSVIADVVVVAVAAEAAVAQPVHHMYDSWRADFKPGHPSIALCGAVGIPIDEEVSSGKWPRNICHRCMGMWEGM